MLYHILGWYSLIAYTLGVIVNLFSDENPTKRFVEFIFTIPIVVFLFMAVFNLK